MWFDNPVNVRYKSVVGNAIDNKRGAHTGVRVVPSLWSEPTPLVGEGPSRLLLPDQVRAFIERQLLDGTLREGDQIVEYRVARTLGISQAPVREALRKLERDGLVVSRPHRGTFVRRVTRRDAAERYSLGMELEAFAARLAMPRLTPVDYSHLERIIDDMSRAASCAKAGTVDFARSVELNVSFHRFLVERANHKMLLEAWLAVNPLNWRFTTYTQLVNPDPVVLAERHRSVLTALRSGDQVMAAATLRAHIWDVAEQVLPNMAEEADGEDEPVVRSGTD